MTRLCALFAVPPANSRVTAVALLVAAVFLAAVSTGAQSTAAPEGGIRNGGGATPSSPDAYAYAYEAEGRRDPFLGVFINPGPRGVLKRGDGAAAYTANEISVRGVMQSRGLLIAIVQGPDKRTCIVHPGDMLADGFVKTVTPQGLVIDQNINDPSSVQKHREIRKLLRSLEDVKE